MSWSEGCRAHAEERTSHLEKAVMWRLGLPRPPFHLQLRMGSRFTLLAIQYLRAGRSPRAVGQRHAGLASTVLAYHEGRSDSWATLGSAGGRPWR